MLFTKLREIIFSIPDHPDEELHKRARIFFVTCSVFILGLFVFIVYYGFFDQSYNIIPMVVLLLCSILSFILNKRGFTDEAASLLIWSVLIGLFTLAFFNSGLFDTSLQAIPAVFIIAALLFQKRQLIFLSLLCLIFLIAIGLYQVNHPTLFLVTANPTMTDIFDLIIIDGGTLILVMLLSAYLKDSIARVKLREGRLSESEERFRTLIEQAPDGFEVLDQSGRFVEVNPARTDQLGFTRDEMLKLTVFDIDPELTPAVFKKLQTTISLSTPLRIESIHRRKDGSTFLVELSISAIRLNGIPHYLTEVRDITERKQAEEALRESEDRFRSLYENSTIGLYRTTPDGKIILANPALVQKLGYSSFEDLAKRNLEKEGFEPSYERKQFIEQIESNGKISGLESAWTRKDGSIVFMRESARVIRDADGNTLYYDGTVEDITERKQIETEIEKMAFMLNVAPNAITVHDFDGRFLYANQKTLDLHGYTKDEFMSLNLHEIDVPVSERLIAPRMKELMDNGQAIFQVEHFRKDRTVIPLEVNAQLTAWGNVKTILSIATDLTERKRAEEALRKSEERLSKSFRTSPVSLTISQVHSGKLVEANEGFERLFGYTREEAIDRHLKDLSIWIEYSQRNKFMSVIAAGGRVRDEEVLFRSKDGKTHLCSYFAEGIEFGDEQCVIAAIIDISERKTLQAQLMQSQKLESIGTLAAGIAHDFNNILNVIIGNTELLAKSSHNEKTTRRIHAVSSAAERAVHLVNQLLMFARKTEVNHIPLFIDDIIEDTVKLLSETFPKTITITVESEKNLPKITADANQLHQVLMNLSVNARDAMASNGALCYRTSIISGDIIRKRFNDAPAEQYVALTVKDTGVGMDEKTRLQIFDPFFTTKEVGKGTGLGMSVVQGIVQNHHGFIDVRSQINVGTEIEVYLPVAVEKPANNISVQSENFSNYAGDETILLIEDEKLTREFAEELLTEQGYTVIHARDGAEGVERFTNSQDRIRLVISDFGLPQFNGEEVFRRIKEIDPEVIFILVSGFLEPEKKSFLSNLGIKDIIAKPFRSVELLSRIRKALDQ